MCAGAMVCVTLCSCEWLHVRAFLSVSWCVHVSSFFVFLSLSVLCDWLCACVNIRCWICVWTLSTCVYVCVCSWCVWLVPCSHHWFTSKPHQQFAYFSVCQKPLVCTFHSLSDIVLALRSRPLLSFCPNVTVIQPPALWMSGAKPWTHVAPSVALPFSDCVGSTSRRWSSRGWGSGREESDPTRDPSVVAITFMPLSCFRAQAISLQVDESDLPVNCGAAGPRAANVREPDSAVVSLDTWVMFKQCWRRRQEIASHPGCVCDAWGV